MLGKPKKNSIGSQSDFSSGNFKGKGKPQPASALTRDTKKSATVQGEFTATKTFKVEEWADAYMMGSNTITVNKGDTVSIKKKLVTVYKNGSTSKPVVLGRMGLITKMDYIKSCIA